MITWMDLLRLGDLSLTLPVAVAMSAGLLMARAWRVAFWWSLLFSVGLGLVGASKIAFMSWGAGWPAVGFKAISGHATGVTAVFPTLFYLLLQGHAERLRSAAALGTGLGLGLLVAALLVACKEHTLAEALAGCAMGAMISFAGIRAASGLEPPRPLPSLAMGALVFLAATWLMQSAHIGYWMIKAARLLSGNHAIHPLTID